MSTPPTLSVREIGMEDIGLIANYWMESTPDHLIGMGVDLKKMPTRQEFTAMIREQMNTPLEKKRSYALIWFIDDKAVGHSNVNKIQFGKEAYMHLHLWRFNYRQRGMGAEFVKRSLPLYFENLKLEELLCEPYALNPAPNKTLEKVGFEFEKEYRTIPGSLNFEQKVKRWKMTKANYQKIIQT